MQILIVEDERSTRLSLQKAVEAAGYEVIMAENGLQAWELFQTSNIRMVINDWMMPKMDGLELCRSIRQSEQPGYVYIIFITSKKSKEDAEMETES